MNHVPSTWTTASTQAIKTGTWRSSLPHYIPAPAPCHQACPVNGEIANWIGLARQRDWRGAWDVLSLNNPFPAIAGRICHHPCESACNRAGFDEALSICKLERAVGDIALGEAWTYPAPERELGQHVAIVGGGPAGLSAAFQLRRRGWRVSLYESQPELGGLMRYGIPPYRLARDVLDGEIGRILALGVQVVCGKTLHDEDELAQLRQDHDAVFIATGAQIPKQLPQLPTEAAWLMGGARYLALASTGKAPTLGPRMLVVGGGSAALDVARSARRAGHVVTILALEPGDRMPAQQEELVEAGEEGITIINTSMLQDVVPQTDGSLRVACTRVVFTPGAARGQFTVTPIEGGGFELELDAIVPAIGQDPELAMFGSAIAHDGHLLAVNRQQATAQDKVWAGGDVSSMARFVTEAIGMGKRAALAIDAALRQKSDAGLPRPMDTEPAGSVRPEPIEAPPTVTLHNIATTYHPHQARASEVRLPVAERLSSGAEVQLALELEQALRESERCFSCGQCTQCDNCFHYCPDLAIQRVDGGYTVLTDYCKGCGICVAECPTGSMAMHEETY